MQTSLNGQLKNYLNLLLGNIKRFHLINPASAILLGLINGIILTVFHTYLPVLLIITFILLISLYFCSKHIAIKVVISLLFGICITLFHTRSSANTYLSYLPNKSCGGIIIAKISDPTATGKSVPWLNMQKSLKAEILMFKYSPTAKWEKVNGKILINLPRKTNIKLTYGDTIESSGYFEIPDSTKINSLFSYKEYLLSKGIQRIFKAHDISFLNQKKLKLTSTTNNFIYSINSTILNVRNFLMNKMTKGITVKYRRFLASILFGCRQGLSYDTKQNFKKSGVQHIFAISGLHVGMLAINLFIILSFLPYKYRHIVSVLILFCYVLSTGMQASALRAFIMIAVWSLHRATFRSVSTINTIFIAAVISLILNPLNIYSMGFIYSFTIVFFLMLSWQNIHIWQKCLNAHRLWIPNNLQRTGLFKQKLKIWSFNVFATTTVCWLSSAGLNMLFGNFFIPGAIISNFLILPFVWILFFLSAFNLFICFISDKLSICIEFIMQIINFLAMTGAKYAGAFTPSHLPAIFVCIYLILLILFLTSKRKEFSIFFLILMLTCISYWKISDMTLKGKIIVLNGGESPVPAILCIPPYKSGALLINVGSYVRGSIIRKYLKLFGCNSIDILVLNKKKESYLGSKLLCGSFNINEVIIPPEGGYSYYFKKNLDAIKEQHTYLTELNLYNSNNQTYYVYKDALLKYKSDKNGNFDFRLYRPKFDIFIKKENKGLLYLRKLEINCNKQKHSVILEQSNFLKYKVFNF